MSDFPPARERRRREVRRVLDTLMLPESQRAAFYRLTHVMTLLLDRAGIRYSAFAGTLLGCVRHRGMIPWDDDVDLMIPEADVPLLVDLLGEIEDYGIQRNPTLDHDPGIFQFIAVGDLIRGAATGSLGLDIFVMKDFTFRKTGPVLHHKSWPFRRDYPRQWVRAEEVYPRRRYPFGPLQLWGMGDPYGYLERSGFALDAATLKAHRARRELVASCVDRLKELHAYPVRSPEILTLVAPYPQEPLFDLDYYRGSGPTAGEL